MKLGKDTSSNPGGGQVQLTADAGPSGCVPSTSDTPASGGSRSPQTVELGWLDVELGAGYLHRSPATVVCMSLSMR